MTKRYGRTVRYLALLLVMSIMMGLSFSQNTISAENSAVSATAEQILDEQGGYKLAANNKNLSLYVDSSNGGFAVVNKANDAIWYSTPADYKDDKISKGQMKTNVRSQLIMEYIAVEDINTMNPSLITNSQVACVAKGGISSESIKNGAKVTFDFKDLGIKIPVKYVLHDDYLEASIDIKNIDEGDKNRIVKVQFLPYMGAAGPQNNGYLFIPDGCGAVAGFNRNIITYTDYEKMIYGSDKALVSKKVSTKEEGIRFPVFGTVIEGSGAMMGIITEGDGASTLLARTGNTKTNYNTISSILTYRILSVGNSIYAQQANGENQINTVTNTPLGIDNYTVRYHFLSGEDASYVGMAKKYRDYLIKEKGLKKNAEKSSLALNVYGTLETEANFLGIKYNKKRLLTGYSETQDIITELNENGVDNVSVQYLGWANNGIYNRKYPTSASPLSILGGKKDFNALIDYLDEKDFEYYLGIDLVNYSESRWFGTSKKADAAKAPNGDIARQYEYSMVTFEFDRDIDPWVLISPNKIIKASSKFFKKYAKLDIDSISILKLGSQVYSDFGKDERGVYRSESIYIFEDLLSGIDIKDIAIEGGNSYAVPYVKRIFEAPINSSGYEIFDYDVPFFQMVLHGYVNYTTPAVRQTVSQQKTMLKAIEGGADLLYNCIGDDAYNIRETRLSALFSSQYSLWKEDAVDFYKQYSKVNDLVWDQEIVNYESLGNEVFKTEYANGVAVYVNYSETEQTVDGDTIPALGYMVKEAA